MKTNNLFAAKNAKGAKEAKTTAICVLTNALIFFRVLCVLRGQKVLLLP